MSIFKKSNSRKGQQHAKELEACFQEADACLKKYGKSLPLSWHAQDTYPQAYQAAGQGALQLQEALASGIGYAGILECCQTMLNLKERLETYGHRLRREYGDVGYEDEVWEAFQVCCICAGVLYEYGLAGKRDEKKALELYRKVEYEHPYYANLLHYNEPYGPLYRLRMLAQGKISFPFPVPEEEMKAREEKIVREMIEQAKERIDRDFGQTYLDRSPFFEMIHPADDILYVCYIQKIISLGDFHKIMEHFAYVNLDGARPIGTNILAWWAYDTGHMQEIMACPQLCDNAVAWAWKARDAYNRYAAFHTPKDLEDAKAAAARARRHLEQGLDMPAELKESLKTIETAQAGKQKARSILDLLNSQGGIQGGI